MSSSTILVIVAHSDDQILGPGGTLAKYASQGKDVHTIILSYGEMSHPHLKKKVIASMRVKEAREADKVIGGKGVTFFGLDEGKFRTQAKEHSVVLKLQDIFLHLQPAKIFTHSSSESHPDHVAVNNLVLQAYDELYAKGLFSCAVYSFGLYGFSFKSKQHLKLVVNISRSFSKKRQAIKVFKSQKLTLSWLGIIIYFKALFAGLKNGVRFAEEFIKER
ncbi:MAG: PIG-L deacetylase family protein [Candidatus Woesearchaeota archaeon]